MLLNRWPGRAVAILAGLILFSPVLPARAERPQPEPDTGWRARPGATAAHHMVVAAHPLAVEAGLEMLAAGGNAVDAMVAVQLVLNLVEPQSSGIGGGAFALYYDAASGQTGTWDGRERAPAAATGDRFLDSAGQPLPFFDMVQGGRAVGVPGVPRLLEAMHARHGRLAWAALFQPAIRLARAGFEVSPRLAEMLLRLRDIAAHDASMQAYFYPGGRPLEAGQRRDNPAFADTLERIAAGGADAFYTGPVARDIVATVTASARNPGDMTLADLAAYYVMQRPPVCTGWRAWRVCGMGPPSSGGIAVGQILGLLARFDLARLDPAGPEFGHLFVEAMKLAFADRELYVADTDFEEVPVAGLLDPAYLAGRSLLIDPAAVLPVPQAPGVPPWTEGRSRAPHSGPDLPGTSHFTIVDDDGNVLSMTTTIEFAFGSGLMVRGFLLNNQMTDFSALAMRDGLPVANRIEGGKRPRSSMSPTIVLDRDGRPVLALGSPGGSRIIAYVARALIAVLEHGLDLPHAFALPHLANRNGVTVVESLAGADRLAAALAGRGHEVERRAMNSGLHGILIGPGLAGAADPRREGLAGGD